MQVKHLKVVPCGHRLDLSRKPRHRNCESCWFAFFQNHREVVEQCIEMSSAGEESMIVSLQGEEFLARWKQFMATIAKWVEDGEIGVSNG